MPVLYQTFLKRRAYAKLADVLQPAVRMRLKYSEDQPREPAGSPDGGQFTSGGGWTDSSTEFQSVPRPFSDTWKLTNKQSQLLHDKKFILKIIQIHLIGHASGDSPLQQQIVQYAEAMRNGDKFPVIEGFKSTRPGERYIVEEGNHRLYAAILNGYNHVPMLVSTEYVRHSASLAITKAGTPLPLLVKRLKYNENHDERGRFAESDGEGENLADTVNRFANAEGRIDGGVKLNAGPVKVIAFRTGDLTDSGRGIFFGDSIASVAAYVSLHEGAPIAEYTISTKNTVISDNVFKLHPALFKGQTFQDAVFLEDKRSGFKSSKLAAQRVEGKIAKAVIKLGHDAIIYTKPPDPARHEIAVVNTKTATIVERPRKSYEAKDFDESEHPRAPAGSSEGGQFTSSGSTAGSSQFINAPMTLQGASAWRKSMQETYNTDKEFKAAADAVTLFTQGDYTVLRGLAEHELTGEWNRDLKGTRWETALDEKMSGMPGTDYKNFFKGQDVKAGGTATWKEGVRAFVNTIDSTDTIDAPMYRGLSGYDVAKQVEALMPGDNFDLIAPTSFTADRGLAVKWSQGKVSGTGLNALPSGSATVIIEVQPGAKGLKAAALSPFKQSEIISSGRYEVVRIEHGLDESRQYEQHRLVLRQTKTWKIS
jgi:hypothetical protein